MAYYKENALVENQPGIVPEKQKVILPYQYREDEHYYIENLGQVKSKPIYAFLKRAFDIVFSLIALLVTAIPMAIVAIIIKCTSKGPVFFKQERLGLNGKQFMLVKFRTMNIDAEKNGARWSSGDTDDRIYPFGSVLRKTRLDELPQFFLILRGHMTFVGPRPERECFYDAFEEHVHGFRERLKVKQGLTGLAQVSGGYDLRPEEKAVYDVEYIKKRSFGLDMKILWRTVSVIIKRSGAK